PAAGRPPGRLRDLDQRGRLPGDDRVRGGADPDLLPTAQRGGGRPARGVDAAGTPTTRTAAVRHPAGRSSHRPAGGAERTPALMVAGSSQALGRSVRRLRLPAILLA